MPLVIDGISKRFGNTWALRDVSLEVDEGSVIGLFGASGSGKSTLLKALAGALKPSSGRILRGDLDITNLKHKERGIALHSGQAGSHISELMAGLFAKSAVGERQLSRFESATSSEAKIRLLDEPFVGMDAAQREIGLAAIRDLASKGGYTVIFASSDFRQILELADEVAVIDRGELVQIGSPYDVYDEPGSVKIARSTGECNLIEARRLSSSDDQVPEFYTIDGGHRIFAQPIEKGRLGAINQNVTLAIRPEQLAMSMGASFPEDNLLKGVVTAIKFRGSTSLIEFDAGGLRLETRVFKVVGLSVGDECMLGLPPHRIIILRS